MFNSNKLSLYNNLLKIFKKYTFIRYYIIIFYLFNNEPKSTFYAQELSMYAFTVPEKSLKDLICDLNCTALRSASSNNHQSPYSKVNSSCL